MLELARFEGRKRLRGAVAISIGLSLFSALYVGIFPSLTQGFDLQAYLDALPPALRTAFGARAIGTIEGYLATELYNLGWVLVLGIYLAYSAATLIADDVEDHRMDVLLSLPVTRAQVVVEKYLSLAPTVLVVNAIVPVAAYVETLLIDDPIAPVDLVAVHLLSIPYLAACAAIGLVASVVADRAEIAQRGAIAVVFALFLFESLVTGTDVAWAGAVAPMRYFDPTAVLVDHTYDVAGSAILVAYAVLCCGVSVAWFRRRDV